MALTPYHIALYQGPETSVRVWLNDVPVMQRLTESHRAPTTTAVAIHMLQPGENTVAIEIDFSPPWSSVYVLVQQDNDVAPPAFRFDWPQAVEQLPPEQRTPLRWEASFEPEGDLFTPAHLSAAPVAFDCHGNSAQHEALRRLHAAVEQRNVDAWAECLALKFDERRRAYAGQPGYDPNVDRTAIVDFFSRPLQVRPLELHNLHFDRRCDGRVAHVTHVAGGSAIEAFAPEDPEKRRLRLNPVMTMADGRWQVFR